MEGAVDEDTGIKGPPVIEWYWFTRSKMDTVDKHSKWTTSYAAHRTFACTPISLIWGEKELYSANRYLGVHPESESEIDPVSRGFGEFLMNPSLCVPTLSEKFYIKIVSRKTGLMHFDKSYDWVKPDGGTFSIRKLL